MPHASRPGDVLAGRYRLVDLLTETEGGRFWRAHDRMLERHVAVHVIRGDDPRAPALMEAARQAATVLDSRILRVLDADLTDEVCYVVNEWGWGTSLDILVGGGGPLGPRRAAWLVSEVAGAVATAHAEGVAHGRLNPENVLIDREGGVRLIGLCVDAALHGRTGTRVADDVVDVGGLLYCALTGKWGGESPSSVPAAPREHGEVLRPRRVRAGVPRALDVLCDDVLHPHAINRSRGMGDFTSARGVSDYLADFVGDPTGISEALLAGLPQHTDETVVVLPQVPEIAPHDVDGAPAAAPVEGAGGPAATDDTDDTGDTDDCGDSGDRAEGAELPTEPGLPIFDDDDEIDVTWLTKPGAPAPPPPPFEEPPERPLFAPDPPAGAPARTPRPGVDPGTIARPRDDYWPFGTGTGRGTGTIAPVSAPPDPAPVPGRRTLRVAMLLVVALVLSIVALVAYNLRHDSGSGGDDDPPAARAGARISGLTAADFDPLGDSENPAQAPLAVDGDAATSWQTSGYYQQLGTGYKAGVGLVVDLGSRYTLTGVDLTFVGHPTSVQLFVSDARPAGLDDLTRIADGVATSTRLTLDLPDSAKGRFLVVWLTKVPPVDSVFRGGIADVVVRGDKASAS